MGFIKFEYQDDEEEEPIEIGTKATIKPKQKKKDFVLDWVEALGYNINPFKDTIFMPVGDFITGYETDRDKINLFIINDQKYGVIYGDKGTGKTMLMSWIAEKLKEYPEKLYVCTFKGEILTKDWRLLPQILDPMLSFVDKKIRKIDKDTNIDHKVNVLKEKLGKRKLVLLIDDVEAITRHNLEVLKKLFDEVTMQFILSTSKSKAEIAGWHDALKIKLTGLTPVETQEMLKKRIEYAGGAGYEPFTERAIAKINTNAQKNPREILMQSQKLAINLSIKLKDQPPKDKDDLSIEHTDIAARKEPKKKKRSEYKIKAISQDDDTIVIEDKRNNYKDDYVIKKVDN